MSNPKSQDKKQEANQDKASLAWNLSDYLKSGEEPPGCVISGVTEGQAMDRDGVEAWISETFRCLRVLAEEYPEKFKEEQQSFEMDLEYLVSIGKITKKEMESLISADNYVFGKE